MTPTYLIKANPKLLIPGKGFEYFKIYSDNKAYFNIEVTGLSFTMQLDAREEKWVINRNRYTDQRPDIVSLESRLNEIIQEELKKHGYGKQPPILYYE